MPISISEQNSRDHTKYEYDDNSSDIYYFRTNKNTQIRYRKYKDINKHQQWYKFIEKYIYDNESSDIFYFRTNKKNQKKYRKYKDINKHQRWEQVCIENECINKTQSNNERCTKHYKIMCEKEEKNPEQKTRKCFSCKVEHKLSEFKQDDHQSGGGRKTTLTSHCKNCRLTTKKNRDELHKPLKDYYNDWRKRHHCMECKEDNYLVLCAILPPKNKEKSMNIKCTQFCFWNKKGGGLQGLKNELTLREPYCYFCYEISKGPYSDKIANSKKEKRKKINKIKFKRGECKCCERNISEKNTRGFDFDHRDPKSKIISISQLVEKSWKFFNEHIDTETQKCDLLCRNCHNLKTYYKDIFDKLMKKLH